MRNRNLRDVDTENRDYRLNELEQITHEISQNAAEIDTLIMARATIELQMSDIDSGEQPNKNNRRRKLEKLWDERVKELRELREKQRVNESRYEYVLSAVAVLDYRILENEGEIDYAEM